MKKLGVAPQTEVAQKAAKGFELLAKLDPQKVAYAVFIEQATRMLERAFGPFFTDLKVSLSKAEHYRIADADLADNSWDTILSAVDKAEAKMVLSEAYDIDLVEDNSPADLLAKAFEGYHDEKSVFKTQEFLSDFVNLFGEWEDLQEFVDYLAYENIMTTVEGMLDEEEAQQFGEVLKKAIHKTKFAV
jgi:hypothetical protein